MNLTNESKMIGYSDIETGSPDMLKKPIYVTKPTLPPFDEFVEEVKKIWDSHILTN